MSKILGTCESIVKSLTMPEHISKHPEDIEQYLRTLNLIYRRYAMDFCPESCGDIVRLFLYCLII